MASTCTRKHFLKTSLVAGAAALSARRLPAATASTTRSPSDEVRLAVVGLGGRGSGHVRWFGSAPGARVVALCDTDPTRLDAQVAKLAEQNKKVTAYRDYRKLLEDSSIDAVVIATPNHWHSLMAIWACQAGKDAYVEKPVSHNVWEGRKVIEAAAKYGRIVQAGTQSRSDDALRDAFAYLQAGNLGKIQWARGLCYKERLSIGHAAGPQPIPSGLDYDLWCGPAPLVPLRRRKLHYDWHWFWDTGNAEIGNQGIHEVDMCRWALGHKGLPPSVMSFGGRFARDDDSETPNTQISVFNYEPAPLIFEVRALPRKAGERAMDNYRGTRVGITIQCEHGYFTGGAGGGFCYDNDGKRLQQFKSAGGGGHAGNFINAVRSRKAADLRAPFEEGHVSSALCHVANISYRLGSTQSGEAVLSSMGDDATMRDTIERTLQHIDANGVEAKAAPFLVGPTLKLDPKAERFVSAETYDPGYWANTLLKRTYRAPFVVPETV